MCGYDAYAFCHAYCAMCTVWTDAFWEFWKLEIWAGWGELYWEVFCDLTEWAHVNHSSHKFF